MYVVVCVSPCLPLSICHLISITSVKPRNFPHSLPTSREPARQTPGSRSCLGGTITVRGSRYAGPSTWCSTIVFSPHLRFLRVSSCQGGGGGGGHGDAPGKHTGQAAPSHLSAWHPPSCPSFLFLFCLACPVRFARWRYYPCSTLLARLLSPLSAPPSSSSLPPFHDGGVFPTMSPCPACPCNTHCFDSKG